MGADGTATGAARIPFSVSFDEAVTGFDSGDVTVGGTGTPGAVAGFAGTGAGPYSFTVTAGEDGTVTVAVPEGAADDAASNGNSASGTFSITYDGTGPVPTISSTVGANGTATGTAAVPFSVSFSKIVTGFTSSDVSLGGTGTPVSISGFAGTGAGPYNFTVTAGSDGTVTVTVPADAAEDSVSNGNSEAGPFVITHDTTGPVPTISSDVGADGTATGAARIPFSVSFDEAVTGFDSGDVTVGGTGTPGAVAGFAGTGAGPYSFTVTAGEDGTVTVTVPADAAEDAASNGNSEAGPFSITYDGTGPVPTISSTVGANGTATGTAAVPFSVSFSKIVTGFTSSDVSLGGTGTPVSISGFAGTGAGPYNFTVTAGSDGTVTVTVPADAAEDSVSNGNSEAGPFVITHDTTGPVPTISSDVGADGTATGAARIPFSVSFDEAVTGFDSGDVTVGGTGTPGAVAGFAGTGAGPYSFTVTAGEDGTVTVTVPADAAEDAASNGNSEPLARFQ